MSTNLAISFFRQRFEAWIGFALLFLGFTCQFFGNEVLVAVELNLRLVIYIAILLGIGIELLIRLNTSTDVAQAKLDKYSEGKAISMW